MRKLILTAAIVVIAAVASADIVASWTIDDNRVENIAAGPIAETGGYAYSFVMNSGGGFAAGGTGSGSTYNMAPGNDTSVSDAFDNGRYVYFTWDAGYYLSLNSVAARYTRSGTGAQNVQWGTIIGGVWTDIGDEISVTMTATPTTAYQAIETTFSGVNNLTSGQLGMAAYNGTGSANNNWLRFDSRPSATPQTALSIDGTMTVIPEPTTLGLLGLGGLAMLVLRRKLRK